LKFMTKVGLVIFVLAIVAGALFYCQDMKGPQVTLQPGSGIVPGRSTLVLDISDPGAGIKSYRVVLVQKDNETVLFDQTTAQEKTVHHEIELDKFRPRQGALQIRVSALDASIFNFTKGNTTEIVFPLVYDSRPPLISVLSKAHNFNRGGSGLIVYRVSEPVGKTGIVVGDRFFPGHEQTDGSWAVMFAAPFNMKSKDFQPRLMAVDAAGNQGIGSFYYHINNHKFRQRKLNVSDRFLQSKFPELQNLAPQATTPLEAYLEFNQNLRKENRAYLGELAKQTAPYPLWSKVFLRQPNTATLAKFADDRTYYYKGKKIDRQTHLGIDLASVTQDHIIASNAGQVVFADYLGIYGQCVVIDHGLGLQTLYAHLSFIGVAEGDTVTRGQRIGRSGTTGLAGGDHLHFGVILNGLPVQPVEWWDATWVKNNISSKLSLITKAN